MGTFKLKRFNGEEIYKIMNAKIIVQKPEEQIVVWIEVDTEDEAIKTLPDTQELNATPNASICQLIDKFNKGMFKDYKFKVLNSYDDETEEYIATIYYCEHQDLNNNKVEIKHIEEDNYHVKWTAETMDVNYYDGSKPNTIVEIEGVFILIEEGDF